MKQLPRRGAVKAGLAATLVLSLRAGIHDIPAFADGSPQSGAPWPEFKQNGARNPVSSVAGPYTLALKWKINTGGPVTRGPIIDKDGLVYVATEKNTLYATRADGTQKFNIGLPGSGTPTYPAINVKDIIVLGLENGQVVGYNTNGDQQWTFDTANAPYSDGASTFRGHPALPSNYGNMLIGNEAGNVYELDEAGAFKGIRRANGGVHAGPLVTPDGTVVWAAGGEKRVYGGKVEGGDKWNVGVDGDIFSTPAASADTIYFGTDGGSVYAINSGPGGTKWQVKPAGGKQVRGSPAIGSDGTIYIGADDGGFYALNPKDGSTKWKYTTGGAINGAPAIAANGLIYVGSMDGVLYVFDQNGKVVSSYRTDQPIDFSSPAIANDGTVYIGSRDNNLYAFKEGGPTPVPTSAATATPAPPAATPVPPTPTNPAIAADGQMLANQPQDVQQAFQAAYGDAAAVRWAQEHNAAIGRG